MTDLTVRVERIRQEALDIKSFELVRVDGGSLPGFAPGSHVDVHIEQGLVRQYSLCSGSDETARYRIAVKNESGSRGGSRAMHEHVKEGDVIQISAPRNNFSLVSGAAHHLLVAGGIGVTPLLSMARHLQAERASFDFQYFSRSIQHTAFHDLISGSDLGHRTVFHYALEPEAVRSYLRRLLWRRREGAHLYLCGPRPFMDLVEATAAATWPPEAVHLEYFSADPASLAGASDEFRVRLARRNCEYLVPAGKSIVDALADHGVCIETSCEQGVCGTCLTGVLGGTPDHRDVFLTEEERAAGGKILPCVSRARSEVLVLDL